MNTNKLQRYTMDSKGLPMFDDEGEYVRFDDVAAELDSDNWISVDQQLPEEGKYCLVFCDYGDVEFAKYCDEEFMVCGKVTHWQPLPKAPKNE